MLLHDEGAMRLYSFTTFDSLPGVKTFVTTRGKVEEGNPYSTDNLGDYTPDDPMRVAEARARLRDTLGVDWLITPHQTHQVKVEAITPEFLQLPEAERIARLEGVDALVTDCPGVAIAVATADCVPVVLYDTERKVGAAIHAGWRGMAGHIIRRTIEVMIERYGVDPSCLQAGVAPSIGVDQFEVGDEVVDAFREAGFDTTAIAQRYPSGRYHVNLWAAAVEELTACGVDLSHIEVAGICTRTYHTEFFSARALGINSGRFLTGILINH